MGSVFKKTFGGSHLKNPNYKRLSVADHDAEESVGIIYRAGYVPFYVGEEEEIPSSCEVCTLSSI